MGGIGIGNGWISSKYHSQIADFGANLGIIDENLYKFIKETEKVVLYYIEKNEQPKAFYEWQKIMKIFKERIKITNVYDVSRLHRDITEDNYVNFLQQPHIRKAIHVGNSTLQDGKNVSSVGKIYTQITVVRETIIIP